MICDRLIRVDFAEKHSEKAPRDKVCHLCYFEVHVLVLTLFEVHLYLY